MTVGSKFEDNDYSGFEVQPNVRASWKVADKQTMWGAVSRAVRSPSRAFHDVRSSLIAFPDPLSGITTLVTVFGSSDYESEDLLAYELGYRAVAWWCEACGFLSLG